MENFPEGAVSQQPNYLGKNEHVPPNKNHLERPKPHLLPCVVELRGMPVGVLPLHLLLDRVVEGEVEDGLRRQGSLVRDLEGLQVQELAFLGFQGQGRVFQLFLLETRVDLPQKG